MEAVKFEHRLQRDLTKKLDALNLIKPHEVEKVEEMETQKISDALLEKFGFDLPHLENASAHFKLEENPDLAVFRKLMALEKK